MSLEAYVHATIIIFNLRDAVGRAFYLFVTAILILIKLVSTISSSVHHLELYL